jgi:RNA polymerase sigma-70 factor (ECF subfamily)
MRLVPGEAEDLTQETFLRAWRWRRNYRAIAPPGAWLMTIARNAAISHTRRQPVVEIELPDGAHTDPGYTQAEDRMLLHSLAHDLTPVQAKVISLRYAHGLPGALIAEQLGVTRNTIHVHLTRGRAKMRASGESA